MKDKLKKLIDANSERELLVISDDHDDRVSLWDYSITTWYSVNKDYQEDFNKDDITYLLLEDYDAFGEILEDALNKL